MTIDARSTCRPAVQTATEFELDRPACLALLASVPVGRLVHTANALPAVLPLTFVIHRGAVYLRTTEATGVKATRSGVVVAFQADAIDVGRRAGWSVTVVGTAVTETDPVVLEELAQLPLMPWAGGERPHVLRIPLELVTGRRVGTGPVRARVL